MPWGNRTFQLIVALASLACGVVCCWLMEESISLTFESISIPKWMLWFPACVLWFWMINCFYILLNTFNPYSDIGYRSRNFYFGLLGLLLLWFGLFLPTNAHALLYKQTAKNTAILELLYVDSELEELSSVDRLIQTFQHGWDTYEQNVMEAVWQLQKEILDVQNIGSGVRVISYIDNLENVLRVEQGTITRIKPTNYSQKELHKVCDYYNNAVREQLELRHQDYEKELGQAIVDLQQRTKNIPPLRLDIKGTLDQLKDEQYDKETVLKNARKVIGRSYAELESQFNGIYTYKANVYRSDRLVKVTKVWGDYFNGRFKHTNYIFWYWILISLVIEIISLVVFLPRTISIYQYNVKYI